MRIQETLRRRVRYHLDATRQTQDSLAKSIGISPQQLSMFLASKRGLSMETVLRTCRAIGVSVGDLEDESRARKPEILAFYQGRLLELYERDEMGFDCVTGAIDALLARKLKKLA